MNVARIGFAMRNKHQDYQLLSIYDEGRMEGSDVGLCHKFRFQFEKGYESAYILKCTGEDEISFYEWGKYREGVFYDEWVPEMRRLVRRKSNFLYKISIPQHLACVTDEYNGRYIIMMEYLENHTPLATAMDQYKNEQKLRELTGNTAYSSG